MIPPRLVTTVLIAATTFYVVGPSVAEAAEPIGTWLTEDGRARVRTERCGPQEKNLCGYVVWVPKMGSEKGKPRSDAENPDPRKQARPVLGHQMIMGLTPSEDNRYTGKIYNADNGKQYDVTIWSEKVGELSVEGCMLAVLCGKQTWKRVADVLPGQLQGPTDDVNGPRADREWAPKHPATTASIAPRRDAGSVSTSAPSR
ncbi:DUF2147 domain-containing protein [Methylobacterium sp. 10]|uniref:DUF2147 domain-containing protein n=1 Tax=Methylobacterium sp. 10 TaxID=1101191 RepID=UPI0032AF53BD